MLKKLTLLFTVVILIAGFTFAQSAKLDVNKDYAKYKHSIKKVTPPEVTSVNYKAPQKTFKVNSPLEGDVIAQTQYGTFSNDVIRDQVKLADGKIYFSPMMWPSSFGGRAVTLIYEEGGEYVQEEILNFSDPTANTGWPALDYPMTGDLAGQGVVGVVAHSPVGLYMWDGSGFISSAVAETPLDPSLAFAGNKIFVAASGDRTEPDFYVSEDYGVTFNQFAVMSDFSDIPWTDNGAATVEIDLVKSDDEQHLAMLGGNANEGNPRFDGDVVPHNVWLLTSDDAGTTWNQTVLLEDGDELELPEYPTFFVDTVTVDGVDYAVNQEVTADRFYYGGWTAYLHYGSVALDNNGVAHVTLTGWGHAFATIQVDGMDVDVFDFYHPVLYWNSADQTWKVLSSLESGSFIINYPDAAAINRGLALAWPNISVSGDGQAIFVTWTGPQFTDGELDIDETLVYVNDVYYVTSGNGGASFTGEQILAGEKDRAEACAHADTRLEKVDDQNYIAHTLYLSMVSPFAITGPTPTDPYYDIVYQTVPITVTSVDSDNEVAYNFALEQNYPNPFNPSTTIKYSVPQVSEVSLKVYDVLGKEVATLVDAQQAQGTYEVNFDASNLASGMYIYTIKAGSFISSKKMLLMK